MESVKISSPFIKLDSFMKFAGLCMTGGEAKLVIADGIVTVNGEAAFQRGKKLMPGDRVEFDGKSYLLESE